MFSNSGGKTVTLVWMLLLCGGVTSDKDVNDPAGILSITRSTSRFPAVPKKNVIIKLGEEESPAPTAAAAVTTTIGTGNRLKIPEILKSFPSPSVTTILTTEPFPDTVKRTECDELKETVRAGKSVRNSVLFNHYNSPSMTTTEVPVTSYRPGSTYNTGGGGGGIYGYTATPSPTPGYKPIVSYYRPSTKPPGIYTITTASPLPPPVPVDTSTIPPPPVTSFRPTFRPTFPPSATATPFTTTTASSSVGSTIIPIIGVEGDDEDEDDLSREPGTTTSTFNTEGNTGRSLFSPLNKLGLNSSLRRQVLGGSITGTSIPSTSASLLGREIVGGSGNSKRFGVSGLNSRLLGSRGLKAFVPEDSNVVTEFVFSDIKCYRTKNKEYFGASIHMKSGFHLPYIRDRPQDPLTSSECRMEPLDIPNAYHINVLDLRGCGVEQCGDSLCLTMVFPRVPTLALADDEVTTIKCLPQKSSISETRTISFAGDNLQSRKSSSTVEGGTQDFAAEVGVFRQNPGSNNGLFVKRVNSGGVVQLGEPLQLRSVVRGGDGWAHSKLTDVKVWRMRDNFPINLEKLNPNEASEVITLVDGTGCRNSEYDVIAESHPLRDPRNNLVHHFTFKAFLFRGQRANEPLIVTAKVQACQEAGECKPSECTTPGARISDPNVSRYKRSASPDPIEHHNASSIVHDFSSQLALRVVGLQDHSATLTEDDLDNRFSSDPDSLTSHPTSFSCTEKMTFSAVGGGVISIFVCGLVLSLIFYALKYRKSEEDNNNNNSSNNVEANCHTRNNNTQTMGTRVSHNYLQHKSECHRKAHKPLPPPPKDYASLDLDLSPSNNNENYPGRSREVASMRLKSDVAKIIHQLSGSSPDRDRGRDGRSVKGGGEEMSEYECIDEVRSGQSKYEKEDRDGVYIVYCCNDNNNKKKPRPTSAPPSLREREKKRQRILLSRQGHGSSRGSLDIELDTEESEESYSTAENISRPPPPPRTVRSVKRNNQQHQKPRSGTGIRRRLSSIYREVYANRCRGGSFPARISPKNVPTAVAGGGGMRRNKGGGERRQVGDKENSDNYSDGFSRFSSDLDSAYCGSTTCDGPRSTESNNNNSKGRREFCREPSRRSKAKCKVVVPVSSPRALTPKGTNNAYANVNGELSQGDHSVMSSQGLPTHFVTRNESATQIIIYPETDV